MKIDYSDDLSHWKAHQLDSYLPHSIYFQTCRRPSIPQTSTHQPKIKVEKVIK